MSWNANHISSRAIAFSMATVLVAVCTVFVTTWIYINTEVEGIEGARRSYDKSSGKKVAIVGHLRDFIEIGNDVSSLDVFASDLVDEYLLDARTSLDQMWAALDAYRNLGVSRQEAQALTTIARVFGQFTETYAEVEKASSADDIRNISIDTGPALTALIQLDLARYEQRGLNDDRINDTVATLITAIKVAMTVFAAIVLLLVVVCYRFMKSRVQRRDAMAALHDNEQRLGGILRNISDGIITIDEGGIIESFNPAAENIFGYSVDEVIGKNIRMLMAGRDHDSHDGYLKSYRHIGKGKILGVGSRELNGRCKDGGSVAIELMVNEMRLGDQRNFIGAIRDISLRKKAEAELHESQRRLSQAQRIARVGHWIWDEGEDRLSYPLG